MESTITTVGGANAQATSPIHGQSASTCIRAAALLDVGAVAAMLGCSTRHVYRLADSGRMPRPVKLGALNRWRPAEIENWLASGCPSCRERRRS